MPEEKAVTPFPREVFEETVRAFPSTAEAAMGGPNNFLTLFYSGAADEFIPWGRDVTGRDKQLRRFWPTENLLAGAIFSLCSRNAAYKWNIEGGPRTSRAVTNMLHNSIANQSRGWIPFIMQVSEDLYTQDNGAFIEIIRDGNTPNSPVIGLGHLDAGRCWRTGVPETPVTYEDRDAKRHKLKWWEVIPMAEFPTSIETMNGVGYSAVTRVMRAAQILKDLATYKHEKVSGRFARAIHIVGGASKKELEDIQTRGQSDADNKGLNRFIMPMILASLDPERPVSHVEIPLASLPDNFDLDTELKWYIAQLALGLGSDYQDFAPLPGGGLGTSTQSEILHRKSRGKGPALFMQTMLYTFQYFGILPQNVEMKFIEQDLAAELEKLRVREARARERSVRIGSGEINPRVAREIAVLDGDLDVQFLAELEEYDAKLEAVGQFGPKRIPRQERQPERSLDDTDQKTLRANEEYSMAYNENA